MARIAKALGTTVARVALAWVQSRPGVASTIIGARTLAQLEDNLAGLDVRLETDHVAKLDQLSKPSLKRFNLSRSETLPIFRGRHAEILRECSPQRARIA